MELTELSYALDTFYLLMSGALVMWMAAGFSMLEAGMVRSKNTTEILTKNILLYAVACLCFLLFGFNLMYGSAPGGFFPSFPGLVGGDDHLIAALAAEEAPTYSKMADFFFQVVFVATATSIVSGAVAERMKLSVFLLFCVAMSAIIYPVVGYWKWGYGFLDAMGFKDFAGSGVVHLTGAVAGLTGTMLLGARLGKYGKDGRVFGIPGANLPLVTLGTFILWLGWFGFNGGSQLKLSSLDDANAVAKIFVNTNAAAVGGVLAAYLYSSLRFGKADLTLILNGALAGLVAITAEPLTPSPLLASIIGLGAGVLVVLAIGGLDKARVDDPVGAISVHGVCGILGLMVVPLSNGEATYLTQAIGAAAIIGWVGAASLAVWLALKYTIGLRLSADQEAEGADLIECGLSAYPEFVPDSARGSQIGSGALRKAASTAEPTGQMLPGRS
jgi:Amt family ammonium transporter